MQDFPGALLVSLALSVVVVFITSALVAEHTSAKLPGSLYDNKARIRRRSLLIELPWAALFLGGGEIVIIMFLLHPNSTLAVRALSAIQLLGATLWGVYLLRQIATSRKEW